jgi:hypothetical protein
LFVCLFVCLFACLFACLFVCELVQVGGLESHGEKRLEGRDGDDKETQT